MYVLKLFKNSCNVLQCTVFDILLLKCCVKNSLSPQLISFIHLSQVGHQALMICPHQDLS